MYFIIFASSIFKIEIVPLEKYAILCGDEIRQPCPPVSRVRVPG
jgi:hypothetical protein